MGQKDGEKWTAADDLQPATPKSDSLLENGRLRLYGLTAPESARADFACRPAEPPTGGRAGRFGAAVRGGPWPGLLRGRLTFHALWVACCAVES